MSVLKVKENGAWKDIPTIVGEAAGFGTVTATVDTNVGTPAVVVTSSGEDTAKNFAFQFKNLGYDDSELQNDFDVLQGQFDTAVAAVTTDTEVTDIRVGADGVTDTTAGASVRRQFTNVKSEIDSIGSVEIEQPTYVGKYIALNGGVGSTVNTDSPTTYASFNSYVISCNEADAFTLDIVGGTTPRPYAWLDSSKKILYARGANDTVDETIVAPANTAYLVINDNSKGMVYKGEPADMRFSKVYDKLNAKAGSNGEAITVNVANAFNVSTATRGKYLASNGVTEVTSANHFYSDYIYVYDSIITGFSGGSTSNMIAFYDKNKNFIISDPISNYLNVTLDSKIVYCRFNGAISVIDAITLSKRTVVNGIFREQVAGFEPIIVKVGTGETYTTLKPAVEYAGTLATDQQAVEIHLAEGTYNALDGFNLSTETSNFTGLVLPNNVHIVGDGDKDNIIISAELPVDISAYSFDRNNISTLNFWKNNSLKNVTVKAKNIRYAVHNDDYKTNAIEDAVENFEDCAFIYEALSSGVDYTTVSKVPFGTGMAKGRRMSFKRCLFQTNETESKFASLFHNNTEQTKPCVVEFESCKFVGGWGGSVKVSSAGSEVTDVMEFKGCKGDKIRFCKESVYTGTSSEFKLYGYGNSFTGYTYEGITENANDTEMML